MMKQVMIHMLLVLDGILMLLLNDTFDFILWVFFPIKGGKWQYKNGYFQFLYTSYLPVLEGKHHYTKSNDFESNKMHAPQEAY